MPGATPENPAKAQLFCLDLADWSIEAQFNPTDFKYTRSVPWDAGDSSLQSAWGRLQYTGGANDTLNVTLLLDQTEYADDWRKVEPPSGNSAKSAALSTSENTESVVKQVMEIHRLTMPMKFADRIRPPTAAFIWGGFQFQGVLTKVDVDFQFFDEMGKPRRALVTVAMMGRALTAANSVDDLLNGTYAPPSKSSSYKKGPAGGDPRSELLDEL